MTSEYQQLATDLVHDLELSSAPVQISYMDRRPEGVSEHPGHAPSVCTFFAEGRKGSFFADTKAHEACEIGAFVLGIPPEGEVGQRLMSTVGMMQKEGYLAPGDEGHIPRNDQAPRYVAYGPLGSLAAEPTAVLMFANPKSAMMAMEAAPGPVPVNGRPMCAIVPTLNHGAGVAVSPACIGSRIYTEMAPGEMIVGVRGDQLKSFAAKVRSIRAANDAVGAEMRRRKAAARAAH